MKIKHSKTKPEVKCPFCDNQKFHRVHRTILMKAIPFSKRYECSRCRGEFLTVFGFLKFKIDMGNSRLINLQISLKKC